MSRLASAVEPRRHRDRARVWRSVALGSRTSAPSSPIRGARFSGHPSVGVPGDARLFPGWARLFSRIGLLAAGLTIWLAIWRWRRQRAHRARPADRRATPASKRESLAPSPQPGPLIAVVSIARQRISIYGSDGLLAQSAVSTGQPGFRTPTGVFSVIQKNRFHRSNIYSGAPMPYMQRITWSGIALHAGVMPGYPASHGCIRLPQPFRRRAVGHDQDGRARHRGAGGHDRRRDRQSAPAVADLDARAGRDAGRRPEQARTGLGGARRAAAAKASMRTKCRVRAS